MITRHHVALTILCTLILCSALVPSDPVFILAICAGAGMGTMVPDIRMKKPQGFRIRTVAWMVSRFTIIIFTPLLCRLYQSLIGQSFDPWDKRLTHSVPGVMLLWEIMAVFLLVPAFLITGGTALSLPGAFLTGVMFGMILHLIGDMSTCKGIKPLFPFSTTKVSGTIRPCDLTDQRIARFQFCHYSVAGIVIGYQYLGDWQGAASVPLCILGISSCLGMMIRSSDVTITREYAGNPANGIHAPALQDPFIARWKAEHPDPEFRMGFYFNKNEQ